jgi:hypothetical protein
VNKLRFIDCLHRETLLKQFFSNSCHFWTQMFNANDFATSFATMLLTLVILYERVSNSLQIRLTGISCPSPHAFASTRHCRYMNVYTQVVSATAISKRMRRHGALVYIPLSDVRKSLSDVRRSLLNRFRHGLLSSASIL